MKTLVLQNVLEDNLISRLNEVYSAVNLLAGKIVSFSIQSSVDDLWHFDVTVIYDL